MPVAAVFFSSIHGEMVRGKARGAVRQPSRFKKACKTLWNISHLGRDSNDLYPCKPRHSRAG